MCPFFLSCSISMPSLVWWHLKEIMPKDNFEVQFQLQFTLAHLLGIILPFIVGFIMDWIGG